MTRIVNQDGSRRDIAVGWDTASTSYNLGDSEVHGLEPQEGYGYDVRRNFKIDDLGNDIVRLYSTKVSNFLAKADFDKPVGFESDGNYPSTWWKKEYVNGGPGFKLCVHDNPALVLQMLSAQVRYDVYIRAKAGSPGQVWVFE